MHGIHAVFVFDDERRARASADAFLGIVSDLDLVAAAWAGIETRTAGRERGDTDPDRDDRDALERAAELMVENSLSHLSVVDPVTRHPVGVLSTIDIARAVAAPA